MARIKRRELLNKTLLVIGLTFIRLPRAFGLDGNPWVLMLGLVPFWFVIINNHMPEIKNPPRIPKWVSRSFLQVLLLFNIVGLLTLISAIFVKAFIEPASTIYLVLAISICIIGFFFFLKAVLSMFREIDFDRATAILGFSYFLLLIVAILRTSLQKPYLLLFIYQIITFLIFGLSAKCILKKNKQDYFKYVCYGLLLYLGLNVFFDLAGFSNQAENYNRAILLSYFGITKSRIYYPLAEGINAFGMVGGAGCVISAAAFIDVMKKRSKDILDWVIICLGIEISLLIIITTDSRGAFLFVFFTAGITILMPKIASKALVGLLMLIHPIGLFLAGEFLQELKFLSPFVRSNTSVLSGREVIWENAIRPLFEFKWVHLTGYGLYGYQKAGIVPEYRERLVSYVNTLEIAGIVSEYREIFESYINTQEIAGIVSEYREIFVSYINPNKTSPENFSLQMIYDQGYLGLLVAFMMFFFMSKNLIKQIKCNPRNREKVQAFSMVIYILLIGSVSIIPSFYARELFFVFIFVWITAGSNFQAGDEKHARAD